MLRAAGELRLNPSALKFWLKNCDRALNIVSAQVPSQFNQARQLVVPLRLERLEGEIFKLPLHLPDAEALCEWGVDLKRLSSDAALLLCWERSKRSHVVQPIAKLDQHHADVLRHGKEHLANVLGVLLLGAHCGELAQFCDAINEGADLIAEALCDLGGGDRCVLWNVMEQRGHEGCRIKAEVGKDQRRLSGVGHIRLT